MNEQDATGAGAPRRYSGGADRPAVVSITDSAYYDVGAWPGWEGQAGTTTAAGQVKAAPGAGFPSWESYDKSSRRYDTGVGLKDRFMVTVTVTNGDKADLDSRVNSMNFSGIATLQ